jgi:serine protease Do
VAKSETVVTPKPAVKRSLGLDLASINDDLRKRYKIKDSVKGVVITAVDPNSPAAEKQLAAGNVIVELQQQPVSTAEELQQRIEQLKKEGRKTVALLVANADGDTQFVALSLQ